MAHIEYNKINQLEIGNLIQYNKEIYSLYDLDDKLLYLNNPDLKNIGIPESEIRPVLLTEHVMNTCNFELTAEPENFYLGKDLVQVRTNYSLKPNKWKIDFKVTIVSDYNDPDPFLVNTFDKIDKGEQKIKYLHQVQNIFKHFFEFELVTID